MGRWFRMDDDVIHDLKVQGLPPELFKAWINILCIASKNAGRLPLLDATAFALRVDAAKATEILVKLVKAGLIDHDGDGHVPHNWEGRQFVTDTETSTNRSRKHRARRKWEQRNLDQCNNDATLHQPLHPVAPIVAGDVAATIPESYRAETEADAEAEKEGTREVALVPAGWPTDWFERFWKKYPNKRDPKGSKKKLAMVAKDGIAFQSIMDGLDRYVAKTDDRPWCNPTTWINQSRWNEETIPNGKAKTGGSIVEALLNIGQHFDHQADLERAEGDDSEASGDDVLGLPAE